MIVSLQFIDCITTVEGELLGQLFIEMTNSLSFFRLLYKKFAVTAII